MAYNPEYQHQYYLRRREELRETKRVACLAWRHGNLDRARAADRGAQKRRRRENPEHVRAIDRKSKIKNLEKIKARTQLRRPQINAYERQRHLDNPSARVAKNCRNRIRSALRGVAKFHNLTQLIGCPVDRLKLWLESQFQSGMNWKNYGSVWHIDHERPCASFNLTFLIQQRECFHYTNLQPMFSAENLRKGSKWPIC